MIHILKNNRLHTLWCLLFCLLLHHVADGASVCLPTCEQGEYHSDCVCLPCPPRTYQEEPVHTYTFCKKWTTKPPQSHYVIAKNGTSKSDVVWRCEDGYIEREYTVNGFECIPVPSTLPPSSSTTETTPTVGTSAPVLFNKTLPSHVPQSNGNTDDTGLIAGLSSAAIVGVFVIVCALLICWKKHKLLFAPRIQKNKVNQLCGPTIAVVIHTNENHRYSEKSDTATEPLIPNSSDKNYKTYLRIVEGLGYDKAIKFLRVLRDPSDKFKPDAIIQFESVKTRDSTLYLTTSFLEWVKQNKQEDKRPIIEEALKVVGRPSLLLEIEEDEGPYFDASASDNKASNGSVRIKTMGTGNEIVKLRKTITRPDRVSFYIYLARILGMENSKTLLLQLPDPDNSFNAFEDFKAKNVIQNDFQNAFAETLEEWWQRNPTMSFECIKPILEDLHRLDVLGSDEFQKLFAKVIPVKAENTNVDILVNDSEEISSSHLENSDCSIQNGIHAII